MKPGILCFASIVILFPSLCIAGTQETLSQLITAALQSHPAIQSQQAQGEAAKADADAAGWQFFPTPSIAVEKAHTKNTDTAYTGDNTISTIRLQQPIWTGGRLTASKQKTEAGVVASEASLEEARQQLALRMVQVYSDWLSAHLKMQANEKSLAEHKRLRDQVARRVGEGVSSESDLTLANSRLQSVVAEIALARAQKDTALARMAQLLGRRVNDSASDIAIARPLPFDDKPQVLLERGLTANPSIQKAQAQAKMQEAAIHERRADLSPEIYLRAERQYGNNTYANLPPENRFFIGVSSRFGAGLSTLSNVESAKAQYQSAVANVDVQSRSVSEQILSDYALAASSESRLNALKASLESAGEVAQSYNRQFFAGKKSWLDVMNAARELAQTELQIADVESAQIAATWRLAIYTSGVASVAERAK